jgi:hypothetical protein
MCDIRSDRAGAADHANRLNHFILVNLMARVVQLEIQRVKQQLFDLPHHEKAGFVIRMAARRLQRMKQINKLVVHIGIARAAKLHHGLTFGLLCRIKACLIGGDADIARLVRTVDATRINKAGEERLYTCHEAAVYAMRAGKALRFYPSA